MNIYHIIIFLLLVIAILINCNDNFIDLPKGHDINCAGLAVGPGMTCGNQKHGELTCRPDENDCFIENNIKKCYCKLQE
jgi:hypothetical protein